MEARAPTLGVHLLETITRGMYSEPMHCIREYVQNAYDSIRAARRSGVLAYNAGTIRIVIDRTSRRFQIRDDGVGLSPEAAAVHLLDIGNSEKARSGDESKRNAGFRGIGRMAGISYCETLRFRTSDGSGKACIVEFNAAAINRLTQRGQEPTTIVHAIETNARIDERPAEFDAHYLEVTLEGVRSDSPFLNQHSVASYLGSVAPVRHDPTKWSYGDKIQSFAADVASEASLETLSVFVCDADGNVQADIRRPFKNRFRTRDGNRQRDRHVRVTDVVALPEHGPVNGWWGWLAVHERRGALADIPFAGIRVRMHNIAVGEEHIVRNLFKTAALSRWCFGEIHITDPDLVPNAQRDDFEPSSEWSRISTQIKEEADRIEREIRKESDNRNSSVSTLKRRSEKMIDTAKQAIAAGVASHYEQEAIIGQLQNENVRLATQEGRTGRTDQDREQLSELRGRLSQTIRAVSKIQRTGADVAQAHLGRQARQVFRTIMNVLKSELNDETFRRIETKINTALQPGHKE